MAALIAAAAGDAATLLKLAIELNGAVVARDATITELRSADETRRAKQADRTRRSRDRHATSRDVTLPTVTERDGTLPPSPQVSLSSPTPLINPSSPPSPASSSSPEDDAAQFDAEQRLRGRLDGRGDAIVLRFLGRAGSPVRRASWVGRLGALMDLSPHFTPAELAEGLEALMTEPEESWKPSVLKAWVRRVRSDAERDQHRSPRAESASASSNDAGVVFAKIRTLVNTATVVGQAPRKFIRRTDVEALGERALAAYDNIGGADRFLDPDETVGFVLRDFEKAYRAAKPAPAGATP